MQCASSTATSCTGKRLHAGAKILARQTLRAPRRAGSGHLPPAGPPPRGVHRASAGCRAGADREPMGGKTARLVADQGNERRDHEDQTWADQRGQRVAEVSRRCRWATRPGSPAPRARAQGTSAWCGRRASKKPKERSNRYVGALEEHFGIPCQAIRPKPALHGKRQKQNLPIGRQGSRADPLRRRTRLCATSSSLLSPP